MFGPPARPGADSQLPVSGISPLAAQSLPLSSLSVLAGAAMTLAGVLMMRLALRRPE